MEGSKTGKAEPNPKKNVWLIGDQQRNASLRHGGIGDDRKLPVGTSECEDCERRGERERAWIRIDTGRGSPQRSGVLWSGGGGVDDRR